jgi:hypothetical protein
MTISLYDATVANFIQTTTAVGGFLERGLAHATDNGLDPEVLTEARLFSDMFPLRFQIVSVVHHSVGAIEGATSGRFGPPTDRNPYRYADLQRVIAEALAALQALPRETVDALEGGEVLFQVGETRLPFLAKDFLLSFSLPNFYFHATTAYDILRSQGAPLGKRDYMGPMRIKR